MTFVQRNRLRAALAVLLAAVSVLVLLTRLHYAPVLAVRTSDAAFRNRFSTVGINQTLHQIFIDIHVTVTILSLAGTQELAVDVTVLAAETVIVGNVPSTYIGLGGPEEEGT